MTPVKSPPRYTTSPSTATAYGVLPTSAAPNRGDQAESSPGTGAVSGRIPTLAAAWTATGDGADVGSWPMRESGMTPGSMGAASGDVAAGTSLVSGTGPPEA